MRKIALFSVSAMAAAMLPSAGFAADLYVGGDSSHKTIQSAVDKAKPGDTIIVRPGVYREMVEMKTSGTPDAPIVIRSEKKGEATLDGSIPLTGWKKCPNAKFAGENPNWQKIYYAEVAGKVTFNTANLYEDGKFCALTQEPEPADPFYYDEQKQFIKVPEAGFTPTQICDPKFFNQKDPHFWDGAGVVIWTSDNRMSTRPIKSFDPATGIITFDSAAKKVNPKKDKYSVINHVSLLKKPGQYAVTGGSGGKKLIFYWPREEKSLEKGLVTVSDKENGFVINGKSYVHIKDFKIRQSSADSGRYRGCGIFNRQAKVKGIVVSGNEVYHHKSLNGYPAINGSDFIDSIIEDNYVHDNQMSRGIGIMGGANGIIRNNTVTRCGHTGIIFFNVDKGEMTNNHVFDNNGHHSNGLTCYLGCKDILIENNLVERANMALTFKNIDNLVVRNNIFIADDDQSRLVAPYVKIKDMLFENNTVLNSKSGMSLPTDDSSGLVIRNNVICNIGAKGVKLDNIKIEKNILYLSNKWVRLSIKQPSDNVVVKNAGEVIKDFKKGDYNRVSGSPLPEAGADPAKIKPLGHIAK